MLLVSLPNIYFPLLYTFFLILVYRFVDICRKKNKKKHDDVIKNVRIRVLYM